MWRLNRTLRRAALAAVICGALVGKASAQSAPAQQPSPAAVEAARVACDADIKQLCAGVAAGGGRILACLKAHRDQVSPGCKQAVMRALQGAPGTPAAGAAASGGGDAGPAPGGTMPAAPGPAAATGTAGQPSAPATPAGASAEPIARSADGAARYYQLKLAKATQKNGDQDTTVYTLLAPPKWKLLGGFTNNADAQACFTDLIQVSGVVKTGDDAYGMGLIPQTTFRYADDPSLRQQMEQHDRSDEKFKLKGCPIKAPMHAGDYIRENLVWKYHPDQPQVTVEPFPELEQLVRRELGLGSAGAAAGAGATRVEAARVRASATSPKGMAIDEWWSAAIVVRPVPMGRGMGYDWHAEQITVFQTPRGKLDGYDKLYRVMATSVRLDPQFQAWSSGIVSQLYAKRAEETRKQNAMIAAFQQHVAETIQGVSANAQRGANNAAYGQDQLVRGVQTFRDPGTGRTVELSNLYDHAWQNGSDTYILSDDPNFNPNGRVSGAWNELQPVRPQP